jgi:hypothetical protein
MKVARYLGFLLILSLIVLPGCHRSFYDDECDIVVINDTRCNLTIYVDGWEAFTVSDGRTKTVDDVGTGRHVLEAKDEDGRLIERRSIDLDHGEDYYWRIDHC